MTTVANPERIVRQEDWTLCICGNQPAYDGFYCSDIDGTIRDGEYGPDANWDGTHMTCLGCGRTFDFETGLVVGRTSPEMLLGAMAAL